MTEEKKPRKQRTIYTAKQKQKAVERCIKIGIKKHAIKSGIPEVTLKKWLAQHEAGEEIHGTSAGRKPKEKTKKDRAGSSSIVCSVCLQSQ